MFNVPIDKIQAEHIQNLITNSVPESKIIDFKRDYHLETDKEKGEFLADVSAFANTSGGYLFFGIDEEEGVATEIKGVNLENKDSD
jgi:predicted HTH transcriptional regulator